LRPLAREVVYVRLLDVAMIAVDSSISSPMPINSVSPWPDEVPVPVFGGAGTMRVGVVVDCDD
jgi:hypothetical protein